MAGGRWERPVQSPAEVESQRYSGAACAQICGATFCVEDEKKIEAGQPVHLALSANVYLDDHDDFADLSV